jgi:hypothetical protein
MNHTAIAIPFIFTALTRGRTTGDYRVHRLWQTSGVFARRAANSRYTLTYVYVSFNPINKH